MVRSRQCVHPVASDRAYRAGGRRLPQRKDPRFAWAAADARLDAWRNALAEWVGQRRSRDAAVRVGNALLDFARAHPEGAATPEAICRRDAPPAASFLNWLAGTPKNRPRLVNRAHEFFGWYLDTHLSARDDQGRLTPSPLHFNPVPRRALEAHPSETGKTPLPTRYLRELRQLLMADDWAWAKQWQRDWMQCVDAQTGETVRVWCPVRASAIALKLLLPLRTHQVRMLDSGEGDSLIHTPDGWLPNTGAHAPTGRQVVRRGFLRRFVDRATDAEITGFFVNTNKSADSIKDEASHGYEIPWEHREAIAIVDALAQWQARFNPIDGPLPWSGVADAEVQLSGTQRHGAVFFLMRDPADEDPRQPISHRALEELWTRLLAELEERMAARGETRPNGARIRFVREIKRSNGRCTPSFGLHSLRVSLLTALATEGAVPLHILSKIIAGHASLVMTLYYVKTDPAALTRCLTEASQKVDAAEQRDFIRHLASEQRKEESFVSNDAAGAAALSRMDAGLWKTVSTGICPVGGTRCGEGGPRLPGGRHGPVPGGALNCVACRFHVTGPAFLPGLVARFNAASLAMEGARREHRAAERALTAAEDARFDRELAGTEGGASEVAHAHSRLEAAETRLAANVSTMQAAYTLIERCKAAARRHGGFNLVLAGEVSDLEIAVRETSQLDLWDAVCQSAHLHPCSEVSEATLRRGQALDRLMMRHGAPPLLINLPDDVALAAGNELMQWMTRQLGREREAMLSALDGRSSDGPDLDELVSDMVHRIAHDAAAAPSLHLEGPR